MRKSSQIRAAQVSGVSARLQLLLLRVAGAVPNFLEYPGMRRLTRAVALFFNNQNTAVLELPSGGRLEIYLNDGYWSKLLKKGFTYEPELDFVLKCVLTQPDTYFLDCGANIGYWSVIASRFLPPGRVIALEASPPQFERLRRNAKLNENRFETILGALWSHDGDTLVIVTNERSHAGSSIVNWREKTGQTGYREYSVESVTIDSVCDRCIPSRDAKIVIKLDVEGAEVQALEGARDVLSSRDVVVDYEDHGQDSSCKASAFFIENLNFDVFYCDEHNTVMRMDSIADVRKVKIRTSIGYNFHACSRDSVFSRMLASRAKSIGA
jgi:FkbM family methyltransferase